MCQSRRSHSPLDFKARFCAIVAVTWPPHPKNAQTEKCDVGQITAVVRPLKKWNSYGQKT